MLDIQTGCRQQRRFRCCIQEKMKWWRIGMRSRMLSVKSILISLRKSEHMEWECRTGAGNGNEHSRRNKTWTMLYRQDDLLYETLEVDVDGFLVSWDLIVSSLRFCRNFSTFRTSFGRLYLRNLFFSRFLRHGLPLCWGSVLMDAANSARTAISLTIHCWRNQPHSSLHHLLIAKSIVHLLCFENSYSLCAGEMFPRNWQRVVGLFRFSRPHNVFQ